MSLVGTQIEKDSEVADGKSLSSIVRYREKRMGILNPQDSHAKIVDRNNTSYSGSIKNISRFGARISMNAETVSFKIGDKIPSMELHLLGTLVYNGPATVVNEIKESDNGCQLGLSLYGDGIDLDQINAILQIDSEKSSIGSIRGIIELSKQILPDFKILVADLSTIFADLKFKLSDEEKRINEYSSSTAHKARLEQQAINVAVSLYGHDIQNIFDRFGQIVEEFSDEDMLEVHKRYFRANFHAHILNAPFVHRAFHKPLGYAGDYGLMVMLYEYEDIGTTLFEKFIHRLGCNAPSAVANKNRVVFLADLILKEFSQSKDEKSRFLVSSVACGPAREIQLFIEDAVELGLKKPIRAVCLDQEEKALEHSQANIRKACKPEFDIESIFLKEDVVIGLIKKSAFKNDIKGSNLISCAGLFDYLSDRVSLKLIDAMYELLAPNGILIIGNVSDKSPDRFSMDFLMEWKLKLRSPEDMLRMVPEGIRDAPGVKVEVIAEPLGLNLFLRIQKPGGNVA